MKIEILCSNTEALIEEYIQKPQTADLILGSKGQILKHRQPYDELIDPITAELTWVPLLGQFNFFCEQCKTVHLKDAYAIAQHAMNVDIMYTCKCGNVIELLCKNNKENE